MIGSKRFDIYVENKGNKYSGVIRDNKKLAEGNATLYSSPLQRVEYTSSFYEVSKSELEKIKKQHGINDNNSQYHLY